MDTRNLLDPITPGEILKEDFLEPLKISINQLARNIGVPPNRISEIVNRIYFGGRVFAKVKPRSSLFL
jgi:plasmid maintenance system antidote protein VapI